MHAFSSHQEDLHQSKHKEKYTHNLESEVRAEKLAKLQNDNHISEDIVQLILK